jgi:hypothetical protein
MSDPKIGVVCSDPDCVSRPELRSFYDWNTEDNTIRPAVAYCPDCGAVYLGLGGPPRRIFSANDYPH